MNLSLLANVVLVGFPGAGKTTVGKALAKHLQYDFLDLDREVETFFRISIPDFIQKYGERAFRQCEYRVLKECLLQDRERNIVLSTGGGTPCYNEAMDFINQHATAVYIKMSKASLHNRLSHAKKKRPLIQQYDSEGLMEYIETTLAIREPIYEQAALVVKGESIDVQELAERIGLNSRF